MAAELLKSLNQTHIVEQTADLKGLCTQIENLEQKIPGGVAGYLERAAIMLEEVKNDVNPLADYQVELPCGVDLSQEKGPGSALFAEFERIGMENLSKLGFVLVAGGMGERLGYPGIKVEIPVEMCTKNSFLELYCKYIKAAQNYANSLGETSCTLPLAIMTSGDTHAKTLALLETNDYFGLDKSQVTLMQQDLVPAFDLKGDEVELVLNEKRDGLEVKPHGHGDVHILMYMQGVAEKWLQEYKLEHVVFFQDTNPLAFKCLPALLGVSVKEGMRMNSVAVGRKAKEAAGAIVGLQRKEGTVSNGSLPDKLVLNVEYSHLPGLLQEQGGDVAVNDQNDSAYPGNINFLLLHLPTYFNTLAESKGVMPEFVNPKFADVEKTTFQKPTRLECLMQDFPRLFKNGEKAGFTKFDRWLCFTCVKNNLTDAKKKSVALQPADCSFSCESDVYWANNMLLLLAGETILPSVDYKKNDAELMKRCEEVAFLGIKRHLAPKCVLLPSFALSLEHLRERTGGKPVKLAKNSMLIVSGDIKFDGLSLDGACNLMGNETASVGTPRKVRKEEDGSKDKEGEAVLPSGVCVTNAGAALEALTEDKLTTDVLKIRGYDLVVKECYSLEEVAALGSSA